jgi:hypothetical protein
MPRRTLIACATAVLCAVALDASAPASPFSRVAVVGKTSISYKTYAHWFRIATKGSPHSTVVKRRRSTVAFLVSAYAIFGEARELGIKITDAQVDAELARTKRESFSSEAEYQQFLRDAGETNADVEFRTRIDMLSGRIMRRVDISRFGQKWRKRTRCLPAYMVSSCGATLRR